MSPPIYLIKIMLRRYAMLDRVMNMTAVLSVYAYKWPSGACGIEREGSRQTTNVECCQKRPSDPDAVASKCSTLSYGLSAVEMC
jgi:hypothetical protein